MHSCGKQEGAIIPRVPVIVAGRSEHPFMSICDLHYQLTVNVEKVKIDTFASYFFERHTRVDSHSYVVIIHHHDFISRIWSS